MKSHLRTVSKGRVAPAVSQINGTTLLQFIIAVLAAVNALMSRKNPSTT